jgi:hypothetical protein
VSLLFALFSLSACTPLGPARPDPRPPELPDDALTVSPSTLDFGELVVLDTPEAQRTITLTNQTDEELLVEGLTHVWGIDEDVFFVDAPAVLRLEPRASLPIDLWFRPNTEGRWLGTVIPPLAVAPVELIGAATAPIASLRITDAQLGAPYVGCAVESTLRLSNEGSETLEVYGAERAGSGDFTLIDVPTGSLNPGDLMELPVRFAPTGAGQQSATVKVFTNDPAAPVSALTLTGLGVPGSGVVETPLYVPGAKADVLLVIDAGAEMWATLYAAQSAASALFSALDDGGVDWQVAVVNGVSSCSATVDPYLRADQVRDYSPEAIAPLLAYGLLPQTQGTRALLSLAVATLERTDAGDCLEGFVRDGAQLHVVLLTRGAESSPDSTASYVSALQARLPDEVDLVISAITGQDAGGCVGGGKAVEAATLTGGEALDVCAGTPWETLWAQVAGVSAAAGSGVMTHILEQEPVEATLSVRAEGRALSAWTYDPSTRALRVNGETEGLTVGEPIEVSYLEALACQE